ncbi:F0F1 ATP synthase subunit B' [Falsochrobactrum shanghaiense]|uniref:ATP synthase subunit b n=1 Tax=Falsochrobactrum shanghaiense TaxID=2201899 RepID=A0A316JVF7_9HYPH|nr:F0F1 ATP synthase subunit B [Falsochrobactrum shanghaiense]PWL19160.1 F0F1 ATP synthase subunit B' [Falsochrobactrum shanghaiense]
MFVSTAFAQTATESQPASEQGTVPATGEVHTETGVAQEAGHGSGVFPPFDSTHYASQVLWLAITFGLFYLFLSRVVLPRIGGVIESRRDRIEQDLEQAARLKQDADNAIAAYEQELAAARAKASSIAEAAREKGKGEADAERASAEAQLEKKLKEAEERIAEIKTRAMSDVGAIAEETAASIVEQILGTKADKSAITAAVKASNA